MSNQTDPLGKTAAPIELPPLPSKREFKRPYGFGYVSIWAYGEEDLHTYAEAYGRRPRAARGIADRRTDHAATAEEVRRGRQNIAEA